MIPLNLLRLYKKKLEMYKNTENISIESSETLNFKVISLILSKNL